MGTLFGPGPTSWLLARWRRLNCVIVWGYRNVVAAAADPRRSPGPWSARAAGRRRRLAGSCRRGRSSGVACRSVVALGMGDSPCSASRWPRSLLADVLIGAAAPAADPLRSRQWGCTEAETGKTWLNETPQVVGRRRRACARSPARRTDFWRAHVYGWVHRQRELLTTAR